MTCQSPIPADITGDVMTLNIESGRTRALARPPRLVAVPGVGAEDARDWLHWQRGYVQALICLDIIAMAMGTLLALETRFGTTHVNSAGLPYSLVVLALIAGWVA